MFLQYVLIKLYKAITYFSPKQFNLIKHPFLYFRSTTHSFTFYCNLYLHFVMLSCHTVMKCFTSFYQSFLQTRGHIFHLKVLSLLGTGQDCRQASTPTRPIRGAEPGFVSSCWKMLSCPWKDGVSMQHMLMITASLMQLDCPQQPEWSFLSLVQSMWACLIGWYHLRSKITSL